MSYILDALKKSQRERERATIPDPLTVQESVLLPKEKRFSPTARGVIAFVLCALIAGLSVGAWYALTRSAPQSGVIRADAQAPALQSVQDTGEKTGERDLRATEKTSEGESPRTIDEDPRRSLREGKGAMQQTASRPLRGTSNGPTESATAAEGSETIPPPDRNRLYLLHELPAEVRQRLPDLSISVFIYADEPDGRMVRMNGVTLKEGQQEASGLKLEEIVPDGVIFNFLDYRFRVRLH